MFIALTFWRSTDVVLFFFAESSRQSFYCYCVLLAYIFQWARARARPLKTSANRIQLVSFMYVVAFNLLINRAEPSRDGNIFMDLSANMLPTVTPTLSGSRGALTTPTSPFTMNVAKFVFVFILCHMPEVSGGERAHTHICMCANCCCCAASVWRATQILFTHFHIVCWTISSFHAKGFYVCMCVRVCVSFIVVFERSCVAVLLPEHVLCWSCAQLQLFHFICISFTRFK